MLMLDHLARYGMVWVFDAAYLIEIAVMLYNLPRRRNGVRDYGFLPWAATIALMGLISLSFALIGKVYSGYGIASIITPVWLAAIAVPAFGYDRCFAVLPCRSGTTERYRGYRPHPSPPPRHGPTDPTGRRRAVLRLELHDGRFSAFHVERDAGLLGEWKFFRIAAIFHVQCCFSTHLCLVRGLGG